MVFDGAGNGVPGDTGIVLKAAAETVPVYCAFCGIREEREARRYEAMIELS